MRRCTLAYTLLPLLLAGCGGSSHKSSSSSGTDTNARVGPQVTVAWPARARDFSAPGSAAFAIVTVPGGGASGADAVATLARPAGTAAVSKTYTVPIAVQPGLRLLRIDFYATSPTPSGFGGGSAPSLATTTLNVKILNDGTMQTLDGKSLGTVGFSSNVASVALATGQTLEAGATADLGVTATTATGGVAALTPGTVNFQITDGTTFLKANADGSFTGLAAGVATVVPTVDGVVGKPVTVAVLAAPVTARTVALAASTLVADPTRDVVYAALPPTTVNGNSVVGIDASTGSAGTPIFVGSNPNILAASDDGTALYVGLGGASAVRRVDLTTNTAGLQFSVGSNGGFNSTPPNVLGLAVQPGHPGTVAVTTDAIYANSGPAIYDDGVARSSAISGNQPARLVWTDASRLIASTVYSSSLLDIAVDDQGATLTRSVSATAGQFVLAGGRLYDRSGSVYDAGTLQLVGKITLVSAGGGAQSFSGPVIDAASKRAYFVEFTYGGAAYLHVYDTDTLVQLTSRRIAGLGNSTNSFYNGTAVVRVGADRLAILLSDQVVFLDNVSKL